MKIGIVVLGKLGLPIAFEIESKEHKVFIYYIDIYVITEFTNLYLNSFLYYLKKFHFDLNLKIYNNSK
mgnify:CR=1